MDTRVEDLIEAYMEWYEVGFAEAIQIMITDLQAATPDTQD